MRYFLFLLALLMIFTGCASTGAAASRILGEAEAAAETMLRASPSTTYASTSSSDITAEDAQRIALEHAGYTPEQVKYLRTDYEIDDGIPQYEVTFHFDRWEFDYEIDARTGNVISFEKDD